MYGRQAESKGSSVGLIIYNFSLIFSFLMLTLDYSTPGDFVISHCGDSKKGPLDCFAEPEHLLLRIPSLGVPRDSEELLLGRGYT